VYFAQFRDADTAEAAATAPPAIRLYFEELRFDFIKNESSMSAVNTTEKTMSYECVSS
jgi:hypothetical protein